MAGDSEKRLVLVITGDTGKAEAAAKKLAGELDGVNTKMTQLDAASGKASNALDKKSAASAKASANLAKVSLAATGAALVLGGLAVKAAMQFEHQIDQVGAVAQATEPELEQLRKTAMKLGADTAFSSNEAAAAMEELAAGGRSVAQIVGGEATAAVSLAAAGNYGLADSAQTIAVSMDIWKGTQLDTNEVVNRLAGAANSSRFGVDDMAQAIAQAGGVAAQMGVSFGDMTTAVAATASSFASGSDAGTSLKTMMLQLDGTTEKAKKVIAEYGLEFRTATGELKPMSAIVDELHNKIGPLGEAQQVAALKTIFGNDAYRSAGGLMKLTGAEFEAMSTKMENTSAADVAAQRMGNLSGDVEQLKGSVETLGIAIGTKAIPALATLAQGATKAVNGFMGLPASTQNAALGIGAIVAVTPLAVSVFQKLFAGTEQNTGAFGRLGTMAGTTSGKLTLLAGGIGTAFLAADIISQKTSGHGILEWVFGDPQQAGKTEEAVTRLNSRLKELGEGTSAVAVGVSMLREAERLREDSHDTQVQQALGKIQVTKDEQAALDALMQSVGGQKATYAELIPIRKQLTAYEQEYFDKQVDWTAKTRDYMFAQVAANEATNASAVSAPLAADALAAVAAPTAAAASAADTAAKDFDELARSLGDAEKETLDYNKALDELIGRFAAANPAVHQLQMENAFLGEELDDLKGKTYALSEDEKARVQVLEETIKKNDALIKGYSDNQEALEGVKLRLTEYMGPTALGGLLTLMDNLKVPQEDQIELLKNIGKGYTQLSTKDIPGAIQTFGELKSSLDKEIWDPIAKAVGTDFVKAIADGYTGPEKENLLRAAGALLDDAAAAGKNSALIGGSAAGKAYVDGIVAGLRSGQAQAAFEVMSNIDALIAAGQAGLDTGSPSKKTRDLIGIPFVQGIVKGIEQESPALQEASRALANDLLATSDQGWLLLMHRTSEEVAMWADMLREGLATGREMSQTEMGLMFRDLLAVVTNSGLPEEAQREMAATIAMLANGIHEGTGVANSALLQFIRHLQETLYQNRLVVPAPVVQGGAGGVSSVSSGGAGQPFITPSNPNVGDTANQGGHVLVWTGSAWQDTSYVGPTPGSMPALGSPGDTNTVPWYDEGTDYVPEDQLAVVHRGEAVLTREENRARRSGRGGDFNVSVVINQQPGESVASIMSRLDTWFAEKAREFMDHELGVGAVAYGGR